MGEAKVYLVTGANRGIGRGLSDIILSRPNTTLVALVRDPNHPTSQSLAGNASGAANTRVIILPYDATSETSALDAVETLRSTHKMTAIDTVIANAGQIMASGPTATLSIADFNAHIATNCTGPLLLFQATLALLQAASTSANSKPKFIAISSAIGSTTLIPKHLHVSTPAYGAAKAAMNHLMHRIAYQHPEIEVQVLTPGPVKTDLLRIEGFSFDTLPEATKQRLMATFNDMGTVCEGLMRLIDGSGGHPDGDARPTGAEANEPSGVVFRDWSGKEFPW